MEQVKGFLKDHEIDNVFLDEPLARHTSFRVGGKASMIVEPSRRDQVIALVLFLFEQKIPFRVIGNGSNILASDKPYNGVIIKAKRALHTLTVQDTRVTVGSGYSLIKCARDTGHLNLSGLEFLGGIPGSIGGALYMNAGAYNKEMKDVVKSVRFINSEGKLVTNSVEDLDYSYRHSIFQKERPLLIIDTMLQLEYGDQETIFTLLEHRKERREQTQPIDVPSAGSTFRNPLDSHAYELIDQAGLRGFSIGGAQVSEKHCNFIVNVNHALASDIKMLIHVIIERVRMNSGITLVPEVEFFNWEE